MDKNEGEYRPVACHLDTDILVQTQSRDDRTEVKIEWQLLENRVIPSPF